MATISKDRMPKAAMQQPYPAAHDPGKARTRSLDRRIVTTVGQDTSVEDQPDLVTASPDPRNPWWELRIIRLLALDQDPADPAAPPLERAA
jgi:hypothetical protein